MARSTTSKPSGVVEVEQIPRVEPRDQAESGVVEVEQIPRTGPTEPRDEPDYYEFDADAEQYTQLEESSRSSAPRKVWYECTAPGCNKAYTKPAQLTYHIDTAHLKLKWFTCIYKKCNKSFYYPSHMKRHLRTHGPKSFYCELCYNSFSRNENLKVHQRKCRLLLMCSVCGETFLTTSDIQKHRQSHCVYLKCLYKDCYDHVAPENIREHLSAHTDVLKCPLCLNMYLHTSTLELHMLQDHKADFLTSADYTSDVDLESWFGSMFSDDAFMTTTRDVTMTTPRDVTRTPRSMYTDIHDRGEAALNDDDATADDDCVSEEDADAETDTTAEAPSEAPAEASKLYYCTEPKCTYSTPTPRWLTKHSLKHKTQGSHTCTVCNKVLCDKWGLSLHMASHAMNQAFPCTFCKKSFPSQSRLSQHCQNVHAESRVWSCEECAMRFTTSKRLMTHYRGHVTGSL